MKVLVSWLRELVDVPVSIDALAEKLHLAGFDRILEVLDIQRRSVFVADM